MPRSQLRRIGLAALVLIAVTACGAPLARPVAGTGTRTPAPLHGDGTPSVGALNPALANRAGFNPGATMLWMDDADRQRELDAMAATGARWIALDLDWNSIQGDGPSSFRWDRSTDTVVREAHARGLKIIGSLAYSPPWARRAVCATTSHCLPTDPATFARFARRAVERYGTTSSDPDVGGTITVWQIWNEPNHVPFVNPTVDVAGYTAMLRQSYTAIKAVDPGATVLAGATAPAGDAPDGTDVSPVNFLLGIYANGGGGYFDAVSHHPYSFPEDPLTNAPWNAYMQTPWLHQVMIDHGDGAKKVWGTEAGAGTGTDPKAVSATRQAELLQRYYAGWNGSFRSFTGPLLWFTVRDQDTDPADIYGNFGVLRHDFRTKPAHAALVALLHR